MPRANLEQLTARWTTQHAKDVVLVMIRRDLSQNDGQGLGSVLRSFKFPHVQEVPNARDLRCVSLEGEELPKANLNRADLSWSSLAESNLQGADFSSANLNRACLAGANLAGANFAGADCRRTDFTRANLAGVNFSGARLDGAVFEEAYSARSQFKNAVATRVNLRGANLDDAIFDGSDLSGSNLSYGGLDAIATPPAASDGLVYDLSREAFEAQAGLQGDPTRASKRLRAMRAELKKHAEEDRTSRWKSGGAKEEPAPQPPPRTPGTAPMARTGPPTKPPTTQVMSRGAPVLPPRPIRGGTKKLRRPTDSRKHTRRAPRPPLPVRPTRPPTRTVERPSVPTKTVERPTLPPRPLTRSVPRPTARPAEAEPAAEAPVEAEATPAPTAPAEPRFAPLNEDTQPHPEWAAAIGELMRLKGSVTKIAIELGESSRLLYDGSG